VGSGIAPILLELPSVLPSPSYHEALARWLPIFQADSGIGREWAQQFEIIESVPLSGNRGWESRNGWTVKIGRHREVA